VKGRGAGDSLRSRAEHARHERTTLRTNPISDASTYRRHALKDVFLSTSISHLFKFLLIRFGYNTRFYVRIICVFWTDRQSLPERMSCVVAQPDHPHSFVACPRSITVIMRSCIPRKGHDKQPPFLFLYSSTSLSIRPLS
jgi:hypothetical protein